LDVFAPKPTGFHIGNPPLVPAKIGRDIVLQVAFSQSSLDLAKDLWCARSAFSALVLQFGQFSLLGHLTGLTLSACRG
jgi:hypothetical protein